MAYCVPRRPGLGQLRTSLPTIFGPDPYGGQFQSGGAGGSAGATVLPQTSPCGHYVTESGAGAFPVRRWIATPCPPPPVMAAPSLPPPPVMTQIQTAIQETRVTPTQITVPTVQVAGGDISTRAPVGYTPAPVIMIEPPPRPAPAYAPPPYAYEPPPAYAPPPWVYEPPIAPAPIIPPPMSMPWVMPPGPEPMPVLGPDGRLYAAPEPLAPPWMVAPPVGDTTVPPKSIMRPGGAGDPWAPLVTAGASPAETPGFDVTAALASVPWWGWGLLAVAGVLAFSGDRSPRAVIVRA